MLRPTLERDEELHHYVIMLRGIRFRIRNRAQLPDYPNSLSALRDSFATSVSRQATLSEYVRKTRVHARGTRGAGIDAPRVVRVEHNRVVDAERHVGPLRDAEADARARDALGERFRGQRPIAHHVPPIGEDERAHAGSLDPRLVAEVRGIDLDGAPIA